MKTTTLHVLAMLSDHITREATADPHQPWGYQTGMTHAARIVDRMAADYEAQATRPDRPSPTLGQTATATHYLRRRSANSERAYSYRKEWNATPASRIATGDTLTGVIIGIRTLSNGTASFSEDGTQYTPDRDGHFTAYLITYDLRRAPVYVLPEHTTLEDQ